MKDLTQGSVTCFRQGFGMAGLAVLNTRPHFEKKYHYLRFRFPLFRPRTTIWSGMLRIGLTAGVELMLLFVYILLVYAIIRGFGPAAQAGFGSRQHATAAV